MGEEGKIISLDEAERKVEEMARKRVKEGRVKSVDTESSELEDRGGIPVYVFRGYAVYTIKSASIFGREQLGKKYFTAQVHAITGQILGFREE
jgi:hypothetical protein